MRLLGVFVVAFPVAVFIAALADVRRRYRERRAEVIAQCCHYDAHRDGRLKFCKARLTALTVHTIIEIPEDDAIGEIGDAGGTALSIEFCARHCPGGCAEKGCVR